MPSKHIAIGFVLPLLISLCGVPGPLAQGVGATALSPAQARTLVDHALASELKIAQKTGHPMRYLLRKATPNLTTTKKIVETGDGDVARLISVNGQPLNNEQEQKELARLDALLDNPAQQEHRKHSEDSDTARVLRILRALPRAFVYQYVGPGTSAVGPVEQFTFTPDRNFSPSNMEEQVLTVMTGRLWIDPNAERVVLLEGRLKHDVNYGMGIIGRLNKGGWVSIEQAPISGDQWRIVHLQLAMTGRILFFSKSYDVVQEQSDFRPVPVGMSYRAAIALLRKDP